MNNEIIIPSVENTSIKIYNSQVAEEKETSCDWHFHYEFELFFLCEGSKIFCTKNQVVKLEEGDLVFVNGRVPHKTITPAGSRGVLIQFNDDFFNDSSFNKYILTLQGNKEADIVFFSSKSDINMQLCKCVKKISKEYLNKYKFYNMYIKSYVSEILSCLYRNNILIEPTQLVDKKSVSKIAPVLDYMIKHYSEHITLEQVSNLAYTEKTYFCKLFKKATNVSFLEYLNFIRIYHAEILLRETEKTVGEISIETGFSSATYFSETFRKINLLSPTAYRKMISTNNL